ncbi:hypothetical protein EOW77_0032280 [Bradyrhizobium yuanmingense]|uniref:hypothetical protein n=1 Tax=Bradyrhizobium yuanmingense TaxID=108015 RepID=UPI000FE383EC|nr:hypothetical protein [Bradyrhizobium yuanmingense]TGN75948.1 hypothetical protein EOW77_0032280 [Bradyrhizobium yuanmingense]
MAIDLEAYRSAMGSALRSQGYACVFITTVAEGSPCRVNYATDIMGAVKRLRRTSPVQLLIQDVLWLPDRGMAMMIADNLRDNLGRHYTAGGWLNLPAATVAEAARSAAVRRHPGVVTFTHAELTARWAHEAEKPRGRKRARPSKSARMAAQAAKSGAWCPGCSREVSGVCHHFNCAIGPNGLDAQIARGSAA